MSKDWIPPQGQDRTFGIYPPQGVKGIGPVIVPPVTPPPPPPPTERYLNFWVRRLGSTSWAAPDDSGFGGFGVRCVFKDGRKIRYGLYRNVTAGWSLEANEIRIQWATPKQTSGYWRNYERDIKADYIAQWGAPFSELDELWVFANSNAQYDDNAGWDEVYYLGQAVHNQGFESDLSSADWLHAYANTYGRTTSDKYAGSYCGYTTWIQNQVKVSYMAQDVSFLAP